MTWEPVATPGVEWRSTRPATRPFDKDIFDTAIFDCDLDWTNADSTGASWITQAQIEAGWE